MRDRSKTAVTAQSRREFLRVVGAGVPSLTLLAKAAGGESTDIAKTADDAEKRQLGEGGDPSYKHLTVDEVARTRYEVHYEEIAAAYGGPTSRAPVISERLHPEIVWVRPGYGDRDDS